MCIRDSSDTKQTVLVPNAEFKIFNIDKNEYVKQYTTYPSKVEPVSYTHLDVYKRQDMRIPFEVSAKGM